MMEERTACRYGNLSLTAVLEQCRRLSWEYSGFLWVAFSVLLFVGILANLLLIWMVARRPRLRTVSNLFAVSVAVADLLGLVVGVPAALLTSVFTTGILNETVCQAVGFLQQVSQFAVAYSLLALTIERSRAIPRPLRLRRTLSLKQAGLLLPVIWTFAGITSIPSWLPSHSQCLPFWKNDTDPLQFLLLTVFLLYLLPVSLLLYFVSDIHRSVRMYRIPPPILLPPPLVSTSQVIRHTASRTARFQVVKMLGSLTAAYSLCHFPLLLLTSLFQLLQIPSKTAATLQLLLPLAQFSSLANYLFNPVLYALLNDSFLETLLYSRPPTRVRRPAHSIEVTTNSDWEDYYSSGGRGQNPGVIPLVLMPPVIVPGEMRET